MAYKSVSIGNVTINGITYKTGDIFKVTQAQGEKLVLARRAIIVADKVEKKPEPIKPEQAEQPETPAIAPAKKPSKKVKQDANS